MLAAISSKQDKWVWMVTRKGNNKHSFTDFIEDHLLAYAIDPKNAVIVMDCAGYHHGHKVMNLMLEKGYGVLYTPPASSNLNPIEKLWSIFKANLTRRMAIYNAKDIQKIKTYDMWKESEQSFKEMQEGGEHQNKIKGNNLTQHVFVEMKKVLDGQIV